MESTPTSTATTPAMPMTVARDRATPLRNAQQPNFVMETICENQLMGPAH